MFCSMLCLGLTAQESDTLNLSILEEVNTDSIRLSEKRRMTTRWFLVDLGWNTLSQTYGNVPQSYYDTLDMNVRKSLHIGVNIFRQRISLYRHRLNLEYGFALDFQRYELKNQFTISPYENFLTLTLVDTVVFTKNRLKITSLSIPLLLEYESNPLKMKKSFHVSFGGYVGFVMGAKQKQKTEEGGKASSKGNFNLSNIQYGLQSEIGFSYLTFFARYGFHPLFIKSQDRGYGFTPMTFGIRLVPFY